MTDPGRPRGGTLGLRLALAFLGVALAAVALLAGLTAAFAAADVSNLSTQQRTDLARAVAFAAGVAYDTNDTWSTSGLSLVLDQAARTGAAVQIRDRAGKVITASGNFARATGPQESPPITVRGQRVGTAVVRTTGSGIGAADRSLKTALLRAIAGAAGLAALLALLTGLAVARRITRPVIRLIAVTRAMAAGDRAVRVGEIHAAGELRELAASFDQMAGTLDRQEQIRRNLVADVAHELRTPIAILQAGHEAQLDGVAEPTPAELGSLRDEVLRLATMVDALQTLAAADAATLQLSLTRQDLAEVAGRAADSLAGRFQTAGIELDRDLRAAPIHADSRWLHQVVTNLLTNALKFTPPGGTVTIESSLAGHQAVLRVTDTGVGIPADELPRIFDRFWRGRQAARVSGSGIGLAVAAELARAHGGDLSATSTPDQGTQLTLTLPLA
jgi:two-component system sensor histidine kinase BaeS